MHGVSATLGCVRSPDLALLRLDIRVISLQIHFLQGIPSIWVLALCSARLVHEQHQYDAAEFPAYRSREFFCKNCVHKCGAGKLWEMALGAACDDGIAAPNVTLRVTAVLR